MRDSGVDGACILITGASGFLGKHLTTHLLRSGARVIGVSRSARTSEQDGLQWLRSGLDSQSEVDSIFTGARPDIVYHLAGITNAQPGIDLVEPTFQGHLASSVWALTAATRLGCRRIVLIGSSEEPAAEGASLVPASPYGAAKAGARAYARMFHQLYQSPVVVARVMMAYGPGQLARKVVPSTILSLLRGEAPRISSGKRMIDWVYVEDVVSGLARLATAEGVNGAELDFGSGELLSVADMVEALRRVIGATVKPEILAAGIPPATYGPADIEATAAQLGWRAATGLAKGLAATVDFYRSNQTAP